ncbi:MAG: GC-type dockerin domain-anchored protein [Planctomycetota bacterium]
MDFARFKVACVAAFACVPGVVAAQPGIHEGDIVLGVDVDRLAVSDGTTDDLTGDFIWTECAFGVELESFARTPNPGFDTLFNTFPPSSAIAYAHRAALRQWNGSDFDTISAETLRMSFGPLAGATTPPSDPSTPVLGPFVGVNSNGEYHNHFTFRLELGGSPADGPESQGVFLAELEMQIDDGSLLPSDPFWLVINNNADSAEVIAALDYARTQVGGCAEVACVADTNGDGALSPGDFNAWVLAFNTGAPSCDQNGDGQCNPGDFNAWILNFNQGCDG